MGLSHCAAKMHHKDGWVVCCISHDPILYYPHLGYCQFWLLPVEAFHWTSQCPPQPGTLLHNQWHIPASGGATSATRSLITTPIRTSLSSMLSRLSLYSSSTCRTSLDRSSGWGYFKVSSFQKTGSVSQRFLNFDLTAVPVRHLYERSKSFT